MAETVKWGAPALGWNLLRIYLITFVIMLIPLLWIEHVTHGDRVYRWIEQFTDKFWGMRP